MKILIIQLRQIGDLLLCTPALRALKKAHPQAELHLLCSSAMRWVLEGNPYLSKILTCDHQPTLKDGFLLRKEKYDAVVDYSSFPRTALLSRMSGAPLRIGYARRGRSFFYTEGFRGVELPLYAALQKVAMLRSFQVQPEGIELDITLNDKERSAAEDIKNDLMLADVPRLCAFSPVSRREYKRWPLEKYARVCDWLHESAGVVFLPLFGPGEESAIDAVIRHSRHPEAFKYPYTTPPFKSLVELIACCSFYFGNDNGIRHLAIAAGLPTATLFGVPRPECWTPPEQERHLWLWGKERLEEIEVGEVEKMVRDLMVRLALFHS